MGKIETNDLVPAEIEMTEAVECADEQAEAEGAGEPVPEARLAETIEEFEAMSPSEVDENAVIDDDALVRGGMVAVKAFVRSTASANALRQRRKRERQAEGGAKQVAVLAPADEASREALKAVGAAMRDGALEADIVQRMSAEPAFVKRLFALDPGVVERVADCDVGSVERLFAVAGMLGTDPAFVTQVLRLDPAVLRQLVTTDQTVTTPVGEGLPETDQGRTHPDPDLTARLAVVLASGGLRARMVRHLLRA